MKKNKAKFTGFDVIAEDNKKNKNIYAKYSRDKSSFEGIHVPQACVEQDNPEITMVFSSNTNISCFADLAQKQDNNDTNSNNNQNTEIANGQLSLCDLDLLEKYPNRVNTIIPTPKKKKLDLRGFEFADDAPKKPYIDTYVPDISPKTYSYKRYKKKKLFRRRKKYYSY